MSTAVPTRAEEAPAAQARSWDVALGFIIQYAPEYSGAGRAELNTLPGFYLRWGRVSLASRSVFVARSGASSGGLRIDLSPGGRWRIGLSLRADSGRQESSSPDLQGMGDVRGTLRARLSGSYPIAPDTRLASSVTLDALGRGGGTLGSVSLGHVWHWGDATRLAASLSLSFADARYMQSYYGVTAAQALSTQGRYPEYDPGGGVRDFSVGLSARRPLAAQWISFFGIGASRLLGAAAASPLTRERSSAQLSVGLVYRF